MNPFPELTSPDSFGDDLFDRDDGFHLHEAAVEYNATPVPYFADPDRRIRLYHGDAMHLLRRAKSEMFDLIFVDPPYFLSNDGITCQAGKMVSVNKGIWDKKETFDEVHAFNMEWLAECKRLLKPDGTIWVSGTMHNIYSVGFAMQSLGYKILNDIAWYKVNPPPNLACRFFTHATETILWARKGPKSRHYFNYKEMKRIGDPSPGKQMQSIWRILPPGKNEKRYGKHPTQKPEALLMRIVESSSKPGNLVLDPFCGSGTTGVACARLGRRFVGLELLCEYLQVAIARLRDETRGSTIFCLVLDRRITGEHRTGDEFRRETWSEIVCGALQVLGGEAGLSEINGVVCASSRIGTNRTWPATVRKVVRHSSRIMPVARGRYRLLN